MIKRTLLLATIGLMLASFKPIWGFFAHRKINRLAVFTLPPEMIGFYKRNIDHIENASVNPDKRRYVVEEEAPRHFLDADHYGDSALSVMPQRWSDAVLIYGADSLNAHGILPWHLHRMYVRLREAFMVRDPAEIIRASAELGHYIADGHVPLHTTVNYNGQLTGQEGIHGFWESRLPELFSNEYDFFVGKAEYVPDITVTAWKIVRNAHELVPQVLDMEKRLALEYQETRFAFETRGNITVRVFAQEYARDYHAMLNGMVEQQMRASIKMTGDFWYTAWVDAGQPDLKDLIGRNPSPEQLLENRTRLVEFKKKLTIREHE